MNGEGSWASWLMTYNPHQLPSGEHCWLAVSASRRQKGFRSGPGKTRKRRARCNEHWQRSAGRSDSLSVSLWFSSPIHTPDTSLASGGMPASAVKACQGLIPHLIIFPIPEQWRGQFRWLISLRLSRKELHDPAIISHWPKNCPLFPLAGGFILIGACFQRPIKGAGTPRHFFCLQLTFSACCFELSLTEIASLAKPTHFC